MWFSIGCCFSGTTPDGVHKQGCVRSVLEILRAPELIHLLVIRGSRGLKYVEATATIFARMREQVCQRSKAAPLQAKARGRFLHNGLHVVKQFSSGPPWDRACGKNVQKKFSLNWTIGGRFR
jgi:hypothetical protein